MLHYVINKLSFLNSPQKPARESSDEEEEENESTSPVKTSVLISDNFDINFTKEEEQVDDNRREDVKTIGIITRMDDSIGKGVIDRTYIFDIATFCKGREAYAVDKSVEFEAFRSRSQPSWTVTSMKPYVSKKEEKIKETRRHKMQIVKVEQVCDEWINLKWGNDKFQKIPKFKHLLPKHTIIPGDWLKVHFKQIYEDERPEDMEPLCSNETLGEIISIEPNQQKVIVGKITKHHNEICVDNEIYLTRNMMKSGKQYPINTMVRCVAVSSSQYGPVGEFQWRAIELTASNLIGYTQDPQNHDEDGFFDSDPNSNFRFKELYENRGGIKIMPQLYIKFQAAKLDTSSAKSITVHNLSNRSVVFHKIYFPHDSSICRFEVELPQRDKDVIRTLAPNESYQFQVICTPLQMGRTKELGVFDFGDIKIARDFIITGLSPDEKLVEKIRIRPDDGGESRPLFQRIKGPEQIAKIMEDNRRTRIRGSAPIRSPFFTPIRIPRYAVPSEIWAAYKDKDETLIRHRFPKALAPLEMKNYSDKFKVALWFEEVDNDVRRRQYDLHNVRLVRSSENFVFNVSYLQDITPPVLIGDPIDVFRPDEKDVKYQGFVKKLFATEVHASFNEVFNTTYSGTLMTVCFCLGRMTYKRQHFAVDLALDRLGQEFLFPFGFLDLSIKDPRIPFIEDEGTNAEIDDSVTPKDSSHNVDTTQKERPPSPPVDTGLFRMHQPVSITSGRGLASNATSKSTNARNEGCNKRAQSLRTPFVSDCSTSVFLHDVQLKWFNKSLNEEQKDAVRRVLRGQARPLPYIIFGPPGTGKTVTVVEAIMQVNKLDPNSRLLVTAPTNHAADVITECLVNSGKYRLGDLVRFNGFLRSETGVPDSIKDYCEDGDNLEHVARNRLIIATCATAGQFFQLNLAPGHFTHVFIDEAGYCTEPETMISAVNLALSKGGQLILAGDPKQLGPVLMSDISQNLNLNLSFLERLMAGKTGMTNIYSKNQEKFGFSNCGYNPLVLTKLVKNYRTHETLLKLPSMLFYDNDLVACASYEEAYQLTQSSDVRDKVLLTQGVPILFHGVQGRSEREGDSPSWYNNAEIVQVVSYVRKLKNAGVINEDIGIITPYRKQAEKLRLGMKFGLLDDEIPKVGSVEEFQGGERKVVILSTVRSLYEEKIDASIGRMGFIFNEKRFNVAITRAKSLMIVVGNPHILWKDARFQALIKYCIELKAYTGCNLPVQLDEVTNQLYNEIKELEQERNMPTLPPDVPTSTYNPDGLEESDFEGEA